MSIGQRCRTALGSALPWVTAATLLCGIAMSASIATVAAEFFAAGVLVAPYGIFAGFVAWLIYTFFPGAVSAFLALPLALAWRAPTRVLVLRRFGREDRSRELRAFLRRSVARTGHVYTLADADIRPSWLVRFPVFLAQLAFFHFRMRTIGSARSLRRVRVAMRVRWARNINWSVSFSKVFPIRCRDEMWRTCVDMMLRETDMVVMDVSQPSASIEWELDRCRRSSPDRLVCVTPPALLERSRATLRNWGLPEPEIARRLLTFGRDGEAELRHRLARLRDRSARAPRAGVDRGAAEALFRGAQAHFSNAIAMVGPLPWVLAAVLALAAAKAN